MASKLTAKKLPVKAPGCRLRFWHKSGAVGINDRLVVYEGDMPVAERDELTPYNRTALADFMIAR